MADVRLIDANALAQRFSALQEGANLRDHVYLLGVLSVIDNAPTIETAQAAHGKWLVYGIEHKSCKCSVCGDVYAYLYNYCPNCGAKMDVKEE